MVSGGSYSHRTGLARMCTQRGKKKSKGPLASRSPEVGRLSAKTRNEGPSPPEFTAERLLETWRDLKKHNKNLSALCVRDRSVAVMVL